MQELTMTPATVVLLLLIAAWAVWAVRRMFFRGLCDCHGSDGKKGCGKGDAQGGCSACSACHGCSACSVSIAEGSDSKTQRR